LELIDDSPVTPGETRDSYDGYEASRAIIQDCEDALTNWVPQHAAVSSKLSTRARNLSQRRASRSHQEPHDLSHQDRPLDRDSFHEPGVGSDGEEDAIHDHDLENHHGQEAESRGREENRAIAA